MTGGRCRYHCRVWSSLSQGRTAIVCAHCGKIMGSIEEPSVWDAQPGDDERIRASKTLHRDHCHRLKKRMDRPALRALAARHPSLLELD